MKTSDFDYHLPTELIAQIPIEPRDQSRLMVVSRTDGSLIHRKFFQVVDYLKEGDVLVFNDSQVIPARLTGRKVDSDGRLEILLLHQLSPNTWKTLVKPAKRVKTGTIIEITGKSETDTGQELSATAEVVGEGEEGIREIRFSDERLLTELGEIPLPPYIHVPLSNPDRYQTVYADVPGSIAAPTAGLHFTTGLIDKLKSKGIRCLFVTLHVGLDTFRPVRENDPLEHPIHQEYGVLGQQVAEELSQAKLDGRRIICAGTTTVGLVEAVAQASGSFNIQPFEGWVDLFIMPGYRFKVVDALITNFHLPRATLLMLVTAFTGKDLIDKAYQEAIAQQYRFYSFGDAMLII